MKTNHMFRDQINKVAEWFQSWNECEQTVGLYSLLKKVSPCQAKFLFHVLDQSIVDLKDIGILEQQANSSTYISSLNNESIGFAVQELLSRLPLLRPGNETVKTEYLKIIPKVLKHAVENGQYIEESRQLLSYSLIHPALHGDERSQLTLWLGHLDDQQDKQTDRCVVAPTYGTLYDTQYYSGNGSLDDGDALMNGSRMTSWHNGGSRDSGIGTDLTQGGGCGTFNLGGVVCNGRPGGRHAPLGSTLSAPPSLSKQVQGSPGGNNGHSCLKRTASVAPPSNLPSNNVSDWLSSQNTKSDDSRNIALPSNDHAPVSPQSSCASSGSGSDSHHDDLLSIKNSFILDGSGMKDVPQWLKNLRLHKYAYLFQQITFDEMMGLTEEWLEQQNVTKGARHKIVISIQKLKERQNVLKQLEKEVVEGCSLKSVLTEMRNMVNGPIKRYISQEGEESPTPTLDDIPQGDLPGQFTRVMGKVCTQLLVASQPDEDSVTIYIQLIDRCIHSDAFTEKQKKLLQSWKQQTQKLWSQFLQRFNTSIDKQRKGWGNTFPGGTVPTPIGRPRVNRPVPGGHRPLHATWSMGTNRSLVVPRVNMCNTYSLQSPEQTTKQALHRTNSAPIRSNVLSHQQLTHRPASDLTPDMTATEPEINARLDSLCRSMTEAAISDGPGQGGAF